MRDNRRSAKELTMSITEEVCGNQIYVRKYRYIPAKRITEEEKGRTGAAESICPNTYRMTNNRAQQL
jgi:hypothetical protein